MSRFFSLGLLALFASGCGGVPTREPVSAPAPSSASPKAESTGPSTAQPGSPGPDIVRNDCLTCHTEDLLRQQRLTQAQWAKSIDKMHRWGAPTEAENVEALTAYLASSYGRDSGPFSPEALSAEVAAALFEPLPDGTFGGGDRARGLALYRDRCLPCHGEGGRGGPAGVNLVNGRILDRAADFAAVIRRGRARMPEFSDTTDTEAADLLSYLRSLP